MTANSPMSKRFGRSNPPPLSTPRHTPIIGVLAIALLGVPSMLVAAAPASNDAQEQAAFEAAAARVAPSVVRIETIGGLEQVDGMLFGTGPTTGLIVDPSGYIISSAFNFINRPTSILVRLPGVGRKSAKLVATDRSRMIVLLKVETDKPLPVCEVAPRGELRVGQWTVAVGRTFESEKTNLAVGILSALDRVWGKAVQTDAAVSPNNYGGPLIDIRGRVIGVLVPLSPNSTEEVAGVEWYDSGIGFAIPMEQIERALPRLKKGDNLQPGVVGISLKAANPITGEPIVGACHPKSPAAASGIKPGDRITEVDGRPIRRAADFKTELGRHYAGDKVKIVLARGKDRLEQNVELVEKLELFQHGFLGILPTRTDGEKGVQVRYVFPDSPAAKAGIKIGDQLTTLLEEPIPDRFALIAKINALEPGCTVELTLRRHGESQRIKATLAAQPSLLPNELPAAHPPSKSKNGPGAQVGILAMKIPEFPNEIAAYVPEKYREDVPHGVVVIFQKPGNSDWKELLTHWKPLCDQYDLIIIAPKSANPGHWTPDEATLVDRLLIDMDGNYNLDPARIVVHGHDTGGTLASLAAFRNRAVIRGFASVEGAPMGTPPENDPLYRLSVYLAWCKTSPASKAFNRAVTTLGQMKIPVITKQLGETPRYLNDVELAELARWIDVLDRI